MDCGVPTSLSKFVYFERKRLLLILHCSIHVFTFLTRTFSPHAAQLMAQNFTVIVSMGAFAFLRFSLSISLKIVKFLGEVAKISTYIIAKVKILGLKWQARILEILDFVFW